MAQVELIMPKMGESIIEATILNWLKEEGDRVELDETVLEIATDKVDSEIPSPVEGTIIKILHRVDEVVEIGKPIAIIETEGEAAASPSVSVESEAEIEKETAAAATEVSEQVAVEETKPEVPEVAASDVHTGSNGQKIQSSEGRFYSPLVKNIAHSEGISQEELDAINGSGLNNRVTKADILSYVSTRKKGAETVVHTDEKRSAAAATASSVAAYNTTGRDEIVKMTRMRKMIADHMVMSKQTSPHVTSFVEVDVSDIVEWRNAHKNEFAEKHGEKITYTPIFMQSVIRALKDFPGVNVSVDGDKIIMKKDLNIGMATALPSGELIVPVIKNADSLSLVGLTKTVNDLAKRARNNKLKPEEIQGGTFTLTNVGTFGNVMGTPIINQPQVAILAVGAIRKMPAVVETEYGDLIAVRHKLFLSLSYDHRVVDGFLGGSFLRRIGDYMEQFDVNQSI